MRLLVLVFLFISALFLWRKLSFFQTENVLKSNTGYSGEVGRVHILRQREEFDKVSPHKCVETVPLLYNVTTKVCVKNATDYISREIINNRIWEHGIVLSMMRALDAYPSAAFLDLGANIGMFSLAAAAMNRKVLSVDAVFKNLAYIRESALLSGTFDNLTLIYNGLSDSYETLFPWTKSEINEGGTVLLTKDELGDKKAGAPPVDTILFADVLTTLQNTIGTNMAVMKIDIESMECRVLNKIDHIFNEVDVFIPYIFIEWVILRNLPAYKDFVGKLYKAGYTPVNVGNFQPVVGGNLNDYYDIMWSHRNAIDLRAWYK